MDEQLKEQSRTLDRKIEEQSRSFAKKFEESDRKIDEMMKMMREVMAARSTPLAREESSRTDSAVNTGTQNPRPLSYTPKVEFPKFNGSNARVWIKKCVKYFNLCKIPEDQKVDLASLHMTDKAEMWISNYLSVKKNVEWSEFVIDLSARFKDESGLNVVEQFNKLQQTGTIEDFIDEFDNVRSLMEQNHHILPDSYFLDSFIGGLKPTVKPFVKAFKPVSVAEAIRYARLQEESIQANSQKLGKTTNSVYTSKPYASTVFSATTSNNSNKPPLLPTPQTKPVQTVPPKNGQKPFKFIPAEIRAEKIAKGLCYYCDQKFERGHKCQFRESQLFTVEIPSWQEENSESDDESVDLEKIEATTGDPCISVSALAGNKSFSTMRVRGMCTGRSLHVLIDSGSTHNFLDLQAAQNLKCEIHPIATQTITVADGNQIKCQGMVKNFTWKFKGQEFCADVLLIPLGSCDMVLGVQWLSTLGTIKWDFQKLWMEFLYQDQSFKLKGLSPKKLKVVNSPCSGKLLATAAQICLLQVKEVSSINPQEQTTKDTHLNPPSNATELELLKTQYADIFKEPDSLPPARGIFDHRIPLQTGANPVNIRPYRYPLKQRDIIEQIIEEMLGRGIIQNSTSPFASPVVLVGKKDGSWRLCVDYRELNKSTVKDKYPIPVVDELIDELAGSTVFSKIDLRAGYHQLRVQEEDVFKTAFKTHSGHYEFLVMPFGLTNAPASFQGWMNSIFKPLLRKCVLVFFDDILIYSSSQEDHWQHLKMVFELMREHSLYAKDSKCSFLMAKVEYLGHFISAVGVETDPRKVEAVAKWPTPVCVKDLRSFLGLAGYYRKFIRNFATISKELTNQLKKGAFQWNSSAQQAFDNLKTALVTAPVLALPDFNKVFVVETDASKEGIGAVLMQDSHPLAFLSKALGPRWQNLSVYEKELLAIVCAVQKWEQYLCGSHFIIKTDQKSLKWLLQQRISTPFQHFWLSKLMGFDYEIQYKGGTENVVADALSRVQGSEILCLAISVVDSDLRQKIINAYNGDGQLQTVIQQIQQGVQHPKFQLLDNLLRRKGKIVVGLDLELRKALMAWQHSSPEGGHAGRDITLHRLQQLFYWSGMSKDVRQFVKQCLICQASKYDTSAYPGLLQPLPIPNEVWIDVSMDFITGLPNSNGKEVILVVVDRLSKYSHFIALPHNFTAPLVAQAYLDQVFKLHGWPRSIVSDRDPIFLSKFWKALFTLHGTDFLLSSSYHPQTDGQTEVVNRCLEGYLRCMCAEVPKEWAAWLPLSEWWFNTHFHSATQATPYEIVYNQAPPLHLPYLPGECPVEAVDRSMQRREQMITTLKGHLLKAQVRMKNQADKHRSERVFVVGEWVWLKLQPYKQFSVKFRGNQKLAQKYYGPFLVKECIGKAAYKLQLPEDAQIHDVFHVSQLKAYHGPSPFTVVLPDWIGLSKSSSGVSLLPAAILDTRMIKFQNAPQIQYLVQWEGQPDSEATWEVAAVFSAKFPAFPIPQKT